MGTLLHPEDATKHEIRNRIASGWRMFWGMKRLLLNKNGSINRRLKLFDSIVSKCVLWCTESWTPRAEELRELEVARHGMLTRIVGCPRREEEEWLDWLCRTTRNARSWAERAGIHDWTYGHFKCKWHWAGHVARRSATTWLYQVSTWRDSYWQSIATDSGAARPIRPLTRRWMKWEDVLRRYCGSEGLGPWMNYAAKREQWLLRADSFACALTC